MPDISIIDLSSFLPPEEVPTTLSIWYDEVTKEVQSYYSETRDHTVSSGTMPGTVKVVLKLDEAITKYARPIYKQNYYDDQKQMILAKPTLILTTDKAVGLGDGVDVITVNVVCKTYDGLDFKWDNVRIKTLSRKESSTDEIIGNAQASVEVLTWDDTKLVQQFKVRAFTRGRCNVRAKYYWTDGGPTLKDGTPSFPVNTGEVSVSFTNPGF